MRTIEFVIVGAHAMGFYGVPRFTGDIDILIHPSADNAEKTLKAIVGFFGTDLGLVTADLMDEDTIQFGRPPVRIDVLKKISGVTNDEVWNGRVSGPFGELTVYYIGMEMLIKNKLATGREKDALDVKLLQGKS